MLSCSNKIRIPSKKHEKIFLQKLIWNSFTGFLSHPPKSLAFGSMLRPIQIYSNFWVHDKRSKEYGQMDSRLNVEIIK